MNIPGCPLCDGPGGALVVEADKFRVIRASETGFPAFYRVVWTDHVAEFSDLAPEDRSLCMDAITRVEQVLRERLRPTKINLAALGNVVPHLHWHVIARFDWDSHFPAPVWAGAQRAAPPERLAHLESLLAGVDAQLLAAFQDRPGNHSAP